MHTIDCIYFICVFIFRIQLAFLFFFFFIFSRSLLALSLGLRVPEAARRVVWSIGCISVAYIIRRRGGVVIAYD
jgi:Na+-driven multidrug efflux pump